MAQEVQDLFFSPGLGVGDKWWLVGGGVVCL